MGRAGDGSGPGFWGAPGRGGQVPGARSLLSTGDEEIVEDTGTNHYWGRGRTGTGRNMLGRILMRTWHQLRAEAGGGRGHVG
ncbi:NADAR domain-containing protein [Kitasatospora sp. NPDC101235]|uniref:NADAR domain-containing protein n=1 Tax=Kitasatospora sp. NPDC101235 TaxID=3364101 RepID=UPI0038032755